MNALQLLEKSNRSAQLKLRSLERQLRCQSQDVFSSMYIPLETLEGLAIDLSFTSGQIEARLVGKQLREVVAKLRDALGTVCDVMPVADIENWKNLDEVDFDQAHHILQGNLNSSGNLRIRTLGFSYLDDEGKRIERPAQVTIRKKIPRRGNSTELASQEAKTEPKLKRERLERESHIKE